jgi:signal transduction histidine kinase
VRRRLLLSTVGTAVAVILLFGAPLAVLVRSQLTSQALDAAQGQAEAVQALLNRQPATLEEAALFLAITSEQTGSRLTLLDRVGRVVVDTGGVRRGALARSPDLAPALEGGVGRFVGARALAVSVPVVIRGGQFILRIERSDAALRGDIRRAWGALAGLAVMGLGVAALAAGWQGSRLARPLEHLAASARRLGEGDFSARAPRSGVPEADEVADALDTTAARLGAMLERSRSFGADASHQLRTPLTALRLQLEAAAAESSPEGRAAALADAEIEADRLEATISELLALAASPAGESEVDLSVLAAERLPSWQALARARNRRVVLQAVPVPPVRVRAAAIGQCLQVLLDNALEHGSGTVTVVVQPTVLPADGHRDAAGHGRRPGVRLCVADEGGGIPEEAAAGLMAAAENRTADGVRELGGDAPRPAVGGHGRGLPLARSLVEAEGGRLRLERTAAGTMVCLVLPAG